LGLPLLPRFPRTFSPDSEDSPPEFVAESAATSLDLVAESSVTVPVAERPRPEEAR